MPISFDKLVPGKTYRLTSGEIVEFSRFSPDRQWAIVHPPGEPDMQSCSGVKEHHFAEEAQPEVKRHLVDALGACGTDRQKLIWVVAYLESTGQIEACTKFIDRRREISNVPYTERSIEEYILSK